MKYRRTKLLDLPFALSPWRSQEHYGRKSSSSEAIVKSIFSSSNIDIPTKFAAYEKESYERIMGEINKVDEEKSGMKREVFEEFLRKVYKRTK